MSITINQHTVGTAAVLTVGGRLTLEGSAGEVERAVRQAMNSGRKEIVIDLHDVSYIDSAGLGELISSYASGLTQGVSVKVQDATPRVLELLRITHLRDVLLA
jgi:anti-sigma B factor antagonist